MSSNVCSLVKSSALTHIWKMRWNEAPFKTVLVAPERGKTSRYCCEDSEPGTEQLETFLRMYSLEALTMSLRARTGAEGSSTARTLHPHRLFTGPNLFRRKAHSASPWGPAWNWLINCVSFIKGRINLMYLWVLMCECWRLRIKNVIFTTLLMLLKCVLEQFSASCQACFSTSHLLKKKKKNVFRS